MLIFKTLIVCALSAIAAAQSGANPLVPVSGSIQAGQPLTIKWNPTTGGTVSLQLRWGNPGALNAGTTIVSGTQNSGSYTWTPPKELKAGTDYTIEIIAPGDQTNYTPQFGIQSSGTGLPSSASSTSGSSSSSSVSSTTTSSASKSSSSASSTSESSSTSTSSSSSSKPTTSPTTVPKNAGNKLGNGVLAAFGAAGVLAAAI